MKVREKLFNGTIRIGTMQKDRLAMKASLHLLTTFENPPKTRQFWSIAGNFNCILFMDVNVNLNNFSAGVGRTSVYIGLDILLDRLESESIIDVFDTVQSLRKNRPNMIQTCAQYISLYELIAMAIQKSK
jgi:protein tyrosine phosphatase